uniref:K Homology domain-containing protein n=1 Tax=Meloidogyne incognita TaxID=6306 RepID=A0A914MQ75_MELIC
MPPSTPSQRRPQQKFNSPNADTFRLSPRSGLMNKLNIDPKNVDCLQLCMDVPFLDHPYLIGPRGRKSQYFMTRYKSLLHFPDTNTRPDGLKLNNVLISGSMKNVEEIRSQIRLRTPIRVIVQIEASNPRQFVSRIEDKINEQSLPIRFNVSDDLTNGVLKTEWRNEELLTKKSSSNDLLTFGIALLPLINPWNIELSHRLIGNIAEQTGCRIFYPPKEKYAIQPPTYFIKGTSMSGILQAGKYLTGLSMLQITFYMPPGVVPTIKQQQLDDWLRDLLVHTTIYNPESSSPAQYKVTLRSFEFCLNGLYMVRSTLLGFKRSVQTVNYDFMKFTKFLIPYTVFSDSKLFYPLYSVDDKTLNWPSKDFFSNFYGGPYYTPPAVGENHEDDKTGVQVVPDTSNVAPPVKSEPAQFVFLHALDHSFNSESAHTCSLIASPIH